MLLGAANSSGRFDLSAPDPGRPRFL